MSFVSKGSHGVVHTPSREVARLFPHAGLVKEEQRGFQGVGESIRAYYRLKIADALFPGTVIQAVGAFHRPVTDPPNYLGDNYRNFLVSQRADTSPEHNIYSAHFEKNMLCVMPCECEACIAHNTHYHSPDIQGKADSLAEEAKQWGIDLPSWDVTDYCSDPQGNIVFFEVDGINPRHFEKG